MATTNVTVAANSVQVVATAKDSVLITTENQFPLRIACGTSAPSIGGASHPLTADRPFSASGLGTSNVGSSNTDEKFTSRWGLMQVSGCMHQWGRDFISKLVVPSSPADATALATSINMFAGRANTEGRGSLYLPGSADGIAAARFGASWDFGSVAGSRASFWSLPPWYSYDSIGARGRSDHLAHV